MRRNDLPRRAAETRDRVMHRKPATPWNAIWRTGVGIVVGALGALLLDTQRGKARRARLIDQSLAVARRGTRVVQRQVRRVGSDIEGKAEAFRHVSAKGADELNAASLSAKVESELFADPSIAKGSINVNVENGTVVLRGEVPDEAASRKLAKAAARIPGVRGVENLLHVPGKPAPVAR